MPNIHNSNSHFHLHLEVAPNICQEQSSLNIKTYTTNSIGSIPRISLLTSVLSSHFRVSLTNNKHPLHSFSPTPSIPHLVFPTTKFVSFFFLSFSHLSTTRAHPAAYSWSYFNKYTSPIGPSDIPFILEVFLAHIIDSRGSSSGFCSFLYFSHAKVTLVMVSLRNCDTSGVGLLWRSRYQYFPRR